MAHLSISELFPATNLNETTIQQSLGDHFLLCENGNMTFHWADFHETCNAMKSSLEKDKAIMDEFKQKELILNRLNNITVWIRTQKKVHHTNMFELYEKYIFDQTQAHFGIDPFGPIDISFISGTGPYRSMAIAECFNKSTYKDFVILYLLKGKLPQRDFRIRTSSRVLLEYGSNYSQAQLINLEQLTLNGMLLSMDSSLFMGGISNENNLRILMDTDCLKVASGKNLEEMKAHLSQFSFNLLYSSRKEDALNCSFKDFTTQSSFDFLKNKKVYLFISYNKLKHSEKDKVISIKNFVLHAKNLILDHYKANLLQKSA